MFARGPSTSASGPTIFCTRVDERGGKLLLIGFQLEEEFENPVVHSRRVRELAVDFC